MRFVRGGDDGNGTLSGAGGRNMAVVLAGKDQIIPAETVWGYLTGEPQPRARWVGKAGGSGSSADSLCSPGARFVKIDDDDDGGGGGGGGGGEDKGKLEVLFYPELDHAMVFDTKDRRRPILDILQRFIRD